MFPPCCATRQRHSFLSGSAFNSSLSQLLLGFDGIRVCGLTGIRNQEKDLRLSALILLRVTWGGCILFFINYYNQQYGKLLCLLNSMIAKWTQVWCFSNRTYVWCSMAGAHQNHTYNMWSCQFCSMVGTLSMDRGLRYYFRVTISPFSKIVVIVVFLYEFNHGFFG